MVLLSSLPEFKIWGWMLVSVGYAFLSKFAQQPHRDLMMGGETESKLAVECVLRWI